MTPKSKELSERTKLEMEAGAHAISVYRKITFVDEVVYGFNKAQQGVARLVFELDYTKPNDWKAVGKKLIMHNLRDGTKTVLCYDKIEEHPSEAMMAQLTLLQVI